MNVREIYDGSDAEATKALYARLEQLGPAGVIARDLFRAQKASARAKVYRGGNSKGRFRAQAYDKKDWSIGNLCAALEQHAAALGIAWGWKEDPAQSFHCWVLYVELPTGQVSFHSAAPKSDQRFTGDWDGVRHASASRILLYTASVLNPNAVHEQLLLSLLP